MAASKELIKWIRFSFSLALVGAMFFLVGFFYHYHLPKIKSWTLTEVEKQSRENSPFRLWPQDVELSFYPLGLELVNVKVLPQGDMKNFIAPTELEKVGASISWVSLLKGQLRIGSLWLEGADVNLFIKQTLGPEKKDENKKSKAAVENPISQLDFSFLEQIPINEINLSRINLSALIEDIDIAFKVSNLNLDIANLINHISIEFASDNLFVKKTKTNSFLDVAVKTSLRIHPKGVQVSALQIKDQLDYLVATGDFDVDYKKMQVDKFKVKTRSLFNLEHLTKNVLRFNSQLELPEATGQLKSDIRLEWSKSNDVVESAFVLNSQNAYLEGFEIGKADIVGKIKNKKLTLAKAEIQNRAGKLRLTNNELDLEKKSFSTSLTADSLEIHRLLVALKIPNVPLKIQMTGNLPCKGSFAEKFSVKCGGRLDVSTLDVWSSMDKDFNIVAFEDASVKGVVTVDSKQVAFRTTLRIKDASGQVNGTVNYKNGFNINYDGTIPEFSKNVKNLAGLQLEGDVRLTGSTFGNSKQGQIRLKADAKNLLLEKFGLGNPKFDFHYKSGLLKFTNINSTYNSTRFAGKTSINLKNKTIDLAIKSSFFDTIDVKELLAQRFDLPVQVIATGSADVKMRGPLELKRLSYEVDLSMFRGLIARESFDQAIINVNSNNGHIETENVSIKKAKSKITLKGRLAPNGDFDSVIIGSGLRIEQSEFINRLGLRLGGQVDFTMKANGNIKDPEFDTFGRMTKTIIGATPVKDSSFRVNIKKEELLGRGRFWGNVVTTEFRIPFVADKPLEIAAKANEWDFTQLFAMFSPKETNQGYNTAVTGTLDLTSSSNWLDNANGKVQIDKFTFERGETGLYSIGPMLINANKGVFNSQNFNLEGPSSFVSLEIVNSTTKNINVNLDSKFDMSLLNIFTPFLDDIRGTMSTNIKVQGQTSDVNVAGSAYMQNAFVRLKGLSQAFEKLTGDLLFSKKSVLLNTLKGEFGGGQLTASGKIAFDELPKVPILINGQLRSANLNIPEGFQTRGNAEVTFKGSRIPYTLAGEYRVASGRVSRSFAPKLGEANKIKPSDFLPKFLTNDSQDPLLLDLKVQLLSPLDVEAAAPLFEAKTRIDGNVNVRGSPTNPLLTGNLRTLPGGQVIFKSNTFDIRSALLSYRNDPPANPTLSVTAETRIQQKSSTTEDTGNVNEYEITMDVQGTGKKPIINLSSQPQLSESDIISLLALGVTATDLAGQDSGSEGQVIEMGTQILFNQTGIGQAIRKTTGVEVGVSATIGDDNTASSKISFKKQFTPKFNMSVSQTSGATSTNNVKAEYKFNDKWSVIGQFEQTEAGDEPTSDTTTTDANSERFGLDLEFKVPFK